MTFSFLLSYLLWNAILAKIKANLRLTHHPLQHLYRANLDQIKSIILLIPLILVDAFIELIEEFKEVLDPDTGERIRVLEIKGARGPKGERGERGETGPQGARGEAGPAGVDGKMGVQGLMGPEGEKGDPGERGPQGERGLQGESANVAPLVLATCFNA